MSNTNNTVGSELQHPKDNTEKLIEKIEKLEGSLNVMKTLLNTLVNHFVEDFNQICLTCGSEDLYKCGYCEKNKLYCLVCNDAEIGYGMYFNEPRCKTHKREICKIDKYN
jgi:hypothetical protein